MIILVSYPDKYHTIFVMKQFCSSIVIIAVFIISCNKENEIEIDEAYLNVPQIYSELHSSGLQFEFHYMGSGNIIKTTRTEAGGYKYYTTYTYFSDKFSTIGNYNKGMKFYGKSNRNLISMEYPYPDSIKYSYQYDLYKHFVVARHVLIAVQTSTWRAA